MPGLRFTVRRDPTIVIPSGGVLPLQEVQVNFAIKTPSNLGAYLGRFTHGIGLWLVVY